MSLVLGYNSVFDLACFRTIQPGNSGIPKWCSIRKGGPFHRYARDYGNPELISPYDTNFAIYIINTDSAPATCAQKHLKGSTLNDTFDTTADDYEFCYVSTNIKCCTLYIN